MVKVTIRFGGLLIATGCLITTMSLGPATLAIAQEAQTDVAALASDLQSVELDKRRDAAYALASLGHDSLPALDALIGGLSDRDEQVWMQSLMAIARIGTDGEKATDALIENLGQQDQQRRYRAAWALSRIGPAALPAVKKASQDESSRRRMAAMDSMGWME